MPFVLFERFFEHLVPSRFLSLELLNGGGDVLDRGGFLSLLMANHDLQDRIDLHGGLAARAFDLDQFVSASHTGNVSATGGGK
jgi:hypothetical protein